MSAKPRLLNKKKNIAPILSAIFSQDGLYRLAGQLFLGNNAGWIRQLQANTKNVDTPCLNQVVASISAGKLDEATRSCMVKLSAMIPTSGVPGNVTNSSFGVQTCVSAAAIVGASECYMMIINVKPNAQGKNDMALAKPP